MGYILTNKVEHIAGQLTFTAIAFPDTADNLSVLNSWCNWEAWTEDNKETLSSGSMSEIFSAHFDSNPNCYAGNCTIREEEVELLGATLIETL